MAFRCLHLADLHLETHFGGRERTRERLRAATLEAFEKAARYARDEDLDAVLIAGDLFDDGLLSLRTELRLIRVLRELVEAGISVIYASGNHDPGGSGWRAGRLGLERVRGDQRLDEPRLLWFADPEPFTLTLARRGLEVQLHGAGHGHDRESDNLAARFPRAEASERSLHVGILHTQVEGARTSEQHARYAPSQIGDLADKHYDYWALGHVHQRGRVSPEAPAWYSGNLLGRNPRETGAKGGLRIDLEPGRAADPVFVPFAETRWEIVELGELESFEVLEDLRGHLATKIEELSRSIPQELALRIVLQGPCPLAKRLFDGEERTALEEELILHGDLLELQLRPGNLHLPRDIERVRQAPTVLADALDLLEELQIDDACVEALAPEDLAGLDSDLRDDGEERRAYLRSLAEGLEEELFDRALGDPSQELT